MIAIKNSVFGLCFSLLFLTACKESPIIIPDLQTGNRTVLVEELTGVRCPNCPDGANELIRLDSAFGEKLIIVSVHAADVYSFPYTGANASRFDYRSPKAEELTAYLGTYDGFPTASINRHTFPPNLSPFLTSPGSWGGFVAQELAKPSLFTMSMDAKFDPATRTIKATVGISPEGTPLGETRLTVMILEDKIVDAQQVNAVFTPDYLHRHVLRDIMTAPTGNILTENLQPGGFVEKTFESIIPAAWVAENVTVVAFVHQNNGNSKDVLQAIEKHVAF